MLFLTVKTVQKGGRGNLPAFFSSRRACLTERGFTLIELVMVMVLIGIMALIVVPRLGSITGSNALAFADKLRADIRYAQNLAMTQNRRYRVYVNAAPAPVPNGYAVVNDANNDGWGATGANEIAQDPAGGGPLSITLNAGRYSGITVSNGIIEFDALGRPTVGGGTNLIVSPGGGTIVITAQTGAVN